MPNELLDEIVKFQDDQDFPAVYDAIIALYPETNIEKRCVEGNFGNDVSVLRQRVNKAIFTIRKATMKMSGRTVFEI